MANISMVSMSEDLERKDRRKTMKEEEEEDHEGGGP